MSDEQTRLERAKKFNRNLITKEMRENTGAFALKIINPKKTQYKRRRINPKNIDDFIEEEINDNE